MAYILFDHGKKIGEIEGWTVASQEPVFKNVLGKEVLSVPAKVECTFISPKPVNRRSQLIVREDRKREFNLQVKTVKGATFVTAIIVSQKDLP